MCNNRRRCINSEFQKKRGKLNEKNFFLFVLLQNLLVQNVYFTFIFTPNVKVDFIWSWPTTSIFD